MTIAREVHNETSRFYMKGGLGCALHTYHAKKLKVSRHKNAFTENLTEQVEKVFQDIGKHNVSFSISQDMIYERTGELVSYSQLHYLSSRHGKDSNDIKTAGDDLVSCMRRAPKCSYSFLLHNIDNIEETLSQKSLEVQKLGDSNLPQETMSNGEIKYLKKHQATLEKRMRLIHVLSDRSKHKLIESTTKLILEDNKCLKEANEFSLERRYSLRLSEDKKLLLGCAWVMDCELIQFKKFPEVIMIDVTNGTNRNELPFVSFIGTDSNGKTFVVARAFVVNERVFTPYRLLKGFILKTLPQKA